MTENGWTEEQIRKYDALALEDHSYDATPEERRRWQTNWFVVLNEGVQGPIRQRFDFREALIVDYTKNMLKVLDKETGQSIQYTKQDKILDNNLKVPRSTTTRFTLELDGNIILQQVRLHPGNGSSTVVGSRIKVGIIGVLQPGLKSNIFGSKL